MSIYNAMTSCKEVASMHPVISIFFGLLFLTLFCFFLVVYKYRKTDKTLYFFRHDIKSVADKLLVLPFVFMMLLFLSVITAVSRFMYRIYHSFRTTNKEEEDHNTNEHINESDIVHYLKIISEHILSARQHAITIITIGFAYTGVLGSDLFSCTKEINKDLIVKFLICPWVIFFCFYFDFAVQAVRLQRLYEIVRTGQQHVTFSLSTKNLYKGNCKKLLCDFINSMAVLNIISICSFFFILAIIIKNILFPLQ